MRPSRLLGAVWLVAASLPSLVLAQAPDCRSPTVGAARAESARYTILYHFGPGFTNREFDKVGVPVRGDRDIYDWGRYDGIKALHASRFNLLTRHNDDRTGANAISTRHVALDAETYGAFTVPGLRNVASTAPCMHDGSLATLRDVLRHYSEIDEVKLHVAASHPHAEPGEALPSQPTQSPLRTLNLTDRQIDDLVAFLHTFTERRTTSQRIPDTPADCDSPPRVGVSRLPP